MSEYHGGLSMARRYPVLWFLWSPGGRLIHRLLWRWGPYKRRMDRAVWRETLRVPGFEDDLQSGLRDAHAGRMYSTVNGEFIPRDTWQPDDPIQPDGWHHDGTGWVRS